MSATGTITVVHCWSAPRSRSTALLYSFEARSADPACPTVAIDEPLYRKWLLDKGDAVSRPYTQAMIEGIPYRRDGDDGTEPTKEEAERWARERQSLAQRIANGAETIIAAAAAAAASTTENADKDANTSTSTASEKGGVIFCKHMAKHSHLYDFDADCEVGCTVDTIENDTAKTLLSTGHITPIIHKHVLLIRDPVAVLSSWNEAGSAHGYDVTMEEVGIVPMLGIYSTLMSRSNNIDGERTSKNVVILDSDDLALRPKETLSALCAELDIPYTDAMLTWDAGPHDCDGPWADWWYANVHRSAGWFGHHHNGHGDDGDYATKGWRQEGYHSTTPTQHICSAIEQIPDVESGPPPHP